MLNERQLDAGAVELNYVKGPDNGPPLVLLHGGSSRWQAFLPIIPRLLLRHTLYAPDLRGHRKSGRVAGRYLHANYAEDVRAFIAGELGEMAVVLGSSLGGLVAVYLTSEHPALVSALIRANATKPAIPPRDQEHSNERISFAESRGE
jgi:pimeloyl-ACP methyl ester carboxylesterase